MSIPDNIPINEIDLQDADVTTGRAPVPDDYRDQSVAA